MEDFQILGVVPLHVCRYFHLVKFFLRICLNRPKDLRESMSEHTNVNPTLQMHTLT